MASIGSLVVNLSANTTQFSRKLGGARKMLSGFARGAGMVAKTGIVGGMAAAGVAVVSVTKQLGELDKVAKLATRTGFDPSMIAAFGFAAEQSGSSVEAANKAMDQFTRRLGDAADGTGEAATMLKQLNIPFEDFQKLSPEKQLLKVADAIAGLPDKAQQANAAYQLFGRSGQELVNVLATGEAGIKAFMKEADSLGLGFSADELARVEAANDAMNRIKRALGASASVLTVKVAPAIESVANWFKSAGDSAGGFGSVVDKTANFIGETWTWLQNKIAFGITAAMATAEFAVTNWQAIAELTAKSTGLAFVEFGNQLHHMFAVKLPVIVGWFANNWQDVFLTAFDYTTTLMINLGKNIRAIWQGVLDFIAGKGFDVDFVPMLEGARSAIKDLPEIPERIQGDVEKALTAQVNDLKDTLKTSFKDTVTARLDTLKEMQKFEAKRPVMPKLTPPEALATGGAGEAIADATTDAAKQAAAAPSLAGALEGADAFKALAMAMTGGQKTPEQQLTEAKKQTTLLKGIWKDQNRRKEPTIFKVHGATP